MSFRVAGAKDSVHYVHCQKRGKCDAFVAVSTTTTTTLHYAPIHYTMPQLQLQLHYITLHYTHYIT